jgi:DNA topoisomerase IB
MVRLRRVSPDDHGWTRRRAGRGFLLLDASGERIPEADAVRVRALAIPPAWQDVWICPRPNGHLQAVGTDAAGRRQYRYHDEWRVQQDLVKFARACDLGRKLPRVRKRVAEDLSSAGMTRLRTAALAVRLLDLGYFRIGSDTYADEYGSIGLTTLTRRHVRKRGNQVVFAFTGKSGVDHEITIDDPACVAAIADLRRRRTGAFEELLAYKEGQRWRRLTPEEVNDYIRELSGLDATAKDFRTWHATVLAAVALAAHSEEEASSTARRRQRRAAVQEVADYLGNTPAVALRAYVHPRILELFDEGRTLPASIAVRSVAGEQEKVERAVLRLLEQG